MELSLPRLKAERWSGVLLGALLVAVLARVSFPIPGTPVPITGQTLGVMLLGAWLGSDALWSLLLYLGLGALGAPVFALGAGGLARLVGPTGGYLVGMVLGGWLLGLLRERGWTTPGRALLALLLAHIPIYLLGLGWLSLWVPNPLAAGLLPFLPGDLFKGALAWRSLVGR